jgi:hypothetical protein
MLLNCHWCGDDFVRPHLSGPAPKYCKPSHRQRSYEQRTADKRTDYETTIARASGATGRRLVQRELDYQLKQNRKLQERLNRIDNVMIGNTRIWELDRIAMELDVDADILSARWGFNVGVTPITEQGWAAHKRLEQFRDDALYIRRLEWDLGQLHVAVKGGTDRKGGKYDPANWKGPRP